PGSFAPLASLSETGNEVIRRCLTPTHSFPTARAFYEALSGTPGSLPHRAAHSTASQGRTTRSPRTDAPRQMGAGTSAATPPRWRPLTPKRHSLLIGTVLAGVLLAG